jgi:hypothetical protein
LLSTQFDPKTIKLAVGNPTLYGLLYGHDFNGCEVGSGAMLSKQAKHAALHLPCL